MIKVILNRDKNLHPVRYKKGDEANIPDKIAERWINKGVAHYPSESKTIISKKIIISKHGTEFIKLKDYIKHENVSIIVLIKDALKYVKKCIESIALYTDNYELIIIDNGSNAETKKYLKNIGYIDYKLITNKENMGISYGWNQGIKIATFDYICFINSDCVVTHDWLPRMLKGFKYTNNVGIVGPSTCRTVPMQTIPESIGRFKIEDETTINHYADIAPEKYTITRLTAFCWIVKREVFDKIGVFDWRRYGLAWHEDVDFAWRVDKTGFKMVWCTASYVHHFGSKTTNEMGLNTVTRGENKKKLDERKKSSDLYVVNDVELGKVETKTSRVSVIILVRDALDYFKKCLESVIKYTSDYELIIIDNGSNVVTKKYISEQQAKLGFTLITNEENKGFSYGTDQGIKTASYNYLCFLNSDTIVTKDWLKKLKAGFSLPDVGLLGPSTSWSRTKQMIINYSRRRFDMKDEEIQNIPNILPRGYEEIELVGFCFLTSKDVIDKIGVFDYRMSPIAYYDDTDFYNRIKKVGYKTYWIKHSYVHHYGHRTAVESKINSRKVTAEALERLRKKKDTDIYVANDVKITNIKKKQKHNKIVVSVNIGEYDNIIEDHYPNPDWEFYLFSNTDIKSNFWNVIKVDQILEPRRQSRLYKWLLCRYFPDAEVSLYIDCNFKILVDINRLLTNDCDILMKLHLARKCLYGEAKVCKQYRLDYPNVIDGQITKIAKEGYPKDYGLHAGNIILRKHTDIVKEFGEGVWRGIENGSHRDQLSLDYVAWKLGLKIGTLPTKDFEWKKHKSNKRAY